MCGLYVLVWHLLKTWIPMFFYDIRHDAARPLGTLWSIWGYDFKKKSHSTFTLSCKFSTEWRREEQNLCIRCIYLCIYYYLRTQPGYEINIFRYVRRYLKRDFLWFKSLVMIFSNVIYWSLKINWVILDWTPELYAIGKNFFG